MDRFKSHKGLIATAVSFWLATIYTAPAVHNFFANGSGYDGLTRWPPSDVFEAVRIVLLGAGWLLFTIFVAAVILAGIAILGIALMFLFAWATLLWESLNNKRTAKSD